MNQPIQEEPQANTLDENDFSLKRDEGNENGMGAVKMAISALVSFGLLTGAVDAGADFMDGVSINHDGFEIAGEMNGTMANLEAPQMAPMPTPDIAPNIDNDIMMSGPTMGTPV